MNPLKGTNGSHRFMAMLLFAIVLLWAKSAMGQSWSGVIAPARAIDWTAAGTPIVEPTNQCGSTIAAYGSMGSPASTATITNEIAACTGGGYVLLGPGIFYLNNCIGWFNGSLWNSNVVLRGSGSYTTFLVFIGSSVGGCGAQNSIIALDSESKNSGNPANVCDVTDSYTPVTSGNIQWLQLENCGTTAPGVGSAANLAAGVLLVIDQVDEVSDTGNLWNCEIVNVCVLPSGSAGSFARTGGTCPVGYTAPCYRGQAQGLTVTAVFTSGTHGGLTCTTSNVCVSVTSGSTGNPGLYMPNWNSTQVPQAWFNAVSRTIVGDGLENLSIDTTNASGFGHDISIFGCSGCWINGVRSITGTTGGGNARSHVAMQLSWHSVVEHSYFYGAQAPAAVSYAVEEEDAWDNLVIDNICQQVVDSCPNSEGETEGNVSAYNFAAPDGVYATPGFMQASFYRHAVGDAFDISEGDEGSGFNADNIHGTHSFGTLFRDLLPGQQSQCDGIPCAEQTNAVNLNAGARYFNIIGSVLGTALYHTIYQCNATTTSPCNGNNGTVVEIITGYTGLGGGVASPPSVGYCVPGCGSVVNYDYLVGASLMLWGNYDAVNGAVRFVSGEVPSGLSPYGNPVPGSHTLPASLFLSGKPSWFGSVSYPVNGPDVTSGNIPNVGGFANENPAMACYLALGGAANGTGGPIAFTPCNGTPPASTTPAPTPTMFTWTGSVTKTAPFILTTGKFEMTANYTDTINLSCDCNFTIKWSCTCTGK